MPTAGPMQVGFFAIMALPGFSGYTQLIPDAKPMLDAVMCNYQYQDAGATDRGKASKMQN